MNEIELKYGCNPNQIPARVYADGGLPFTVLNGRPGYINLLDALNSCPPPPRSSMSAPQGQHSASRSPIHSRGRPMRRKASSRLWRVPTCVHAARTA